MAIEPVKIPQNVYVEDRIIGPLTLRQIIVMLVGGGFSYMLYTSLAKANGGNLPIVVTVLVWIPCAIAVLFALVKVNDLSLLRILLLLVERSNKPARRQWTPRQGISIHIRTASKEVEAAEEKKRQEQEKIQAAAKHAQHRIEELSTVLDHPSTAGVIDDESDAQPSENTSSSDEDTHSPAPTLPVDPSRIQVDGSKHDAPGGLSAYDGVFRDISPHS